MRTYDDYLTTIPAPDGHPPIGKLQLSNVEKAWRLQSLDAELELDEIDAAFVPYLRRINAMRYAMTTQCCEGHERDRFGNFCRAHLDLRLGFEPGEVVRRVLVPWMDEGPPCAEVYRSVDIDSEAGVSYLFRLDNAHWRAQVERLIGLLEEVHERWSGAVPDGWILQKETR